MEERKTGMTHRMSFDSRTAGTVTGVLDVHSFDEQEILLVTLEGKLLVKGEQLHVKQLNLEKGQVDLEGKINSLTYLTKDGAKKGESLLKRMFR